jgi:hypothetical protein
MDNKELIGHIGVDSGQVMIVDPCYLSKWEDNDFNYTTGIKNKKTGRIICCWDKVEGIGVIRWDSPLPEFDNKSMNELAEDKENWEKYDVYFDKGQFNYSGVCGVTAQDTHGEIGMQTAVASSTYMGDGCYPVYAIKDERGRVKKLIIDFYGEDEENDDDM